MLIASTLTFWFSIAHPEKHDAEQFETNALPADQLLAAAPATAQTSAQSEQIFLEGKGGEGLQDNLLQCLC